MNGDSMIKIESIDLTTQTGSSRVGRFQVSLWEESQSDAYILRFALGGETLAELYTTGGYESALWGVYLAALYVADLARPNLGHTVAVEGNHLIDGAVKNLLDCQTGVRVVPAANFTEGSVDTLIVCSPSQLAEMLPHVARNGKVVLTCSLFDSQSIDLYSTVHRKGIRVLGVGFGNGFAMRIPDLNRRLLKLTTRYGRVAVAFQEQTTRIKATQRC